MTTPLDKARFLGELGNHAGAASLDDAPETLEAVFDRLHDPDDFGPRTIAMLAAARAAVVRTPITLEHDPLLSDVTVYPGDVRALADFTFNSHVLVLGDLDVEGVVTASPAHAILMVAGSVRCRATHLVRAYPFVTGDLVARDCFFGCTYGLAMVGGSIATRLYLIDGSWTNLILDGDGEPTIANVVAEWIVDIEQPDAREQLERVLVPAALVDDDGDQDERHPFGRGSAQLHALLGKIARGDQVFRETR